MAHQATINRSATNGSETSSSAAARATHSASAVMRDVWALAELQCTLLAADFRESRQRMVTALIGMLVGVVLLLAALPVALIALAQWLMTAAELSQAAAYGWAALGAVVVAAGALLIGWLRLNASLASFSRSREELGRNLHAIHCLVGSCDERTSRF